MHIYHWLLEIIGGYQIGKWVYQAVEAYLLHRSQRAWGHSERDRV
jgi:hypothetical protein